MNKKENTKSVLSFTLLFSLGISSFPLTTAIHADTREEPSVEKTILFNGAYIIIFEYLQQDKYAEALQLTSRFQSSLQQTHYKTGGHKVAGAG